MDKSVLAYLRRLVLAQYLLKLAGATPTAWEQKGVAVAAYSVAVLCKYL